MSDRVHVLMPTGVRDPARPSGGNVYDLRVCAGLAARGWSVREHEVSGAWPRPDDAARTCLGQVMVSVPEGDTALIDGLVGSAVPEIVVAQADRLRLGVLVHLPLGHAFPSEPVREREEQALTAAHDVVATSEWTRGWLLEAYRLDPERVRVAVPGADPAPLSPGLASGRRLLAVGPVSHGKGHDTLMAALDQVRDLDWRLDCIGSLGVDPDTARRVASWADASSGRVRVPGPLVGPPLDAAYASADLLVHPSRAETYAMVLTEALARGLPVIGSDVGGTREALGNADRVGTPGLLVPPGDADALAAALRLWLTDEDARGRLRAAALARRDDRPTWDATVDVVDEVLRSAAVVGAPR